jgi:signal peptidase I
MMNVTDTSAPAEATAGSGMRVSHWVRLVVANAARATIAFALGLLLWAVLPLAIGWQPTTVVTGSMEPRIAVGDVVVSRPVDTASLKAGQVLLFDDPDHEGRLRLHRLDAIAADGRLITRGDANATADSTPVRTAAVHGVGTLRVPVVGMPNLWLAEGRVDLLALLAVVAAALGWCAVCDREIRRPVRARAAAATDEADEADTAATTAATDTTAATPSAGAFARLRRKSVLLPTAISVAAVLALVFALDASAASARAAFTSTTGSHASLGAGGAFSCLTRQPIGSPLLSFDYNTTSGTLEPNRGSASASGVLSSTVQRVNGGCVSSPYITLDGVSSRVDEDPAAPVATAPAQFSVEVWFRSSTRGGTLIGFGNARDDSADHYDRQLYIGADGHLVFGVWYPPSILNWEGNAVTIASPAAVDDGRWHHAVATFGTAGMVLYLDGAQVATSNNNTAESYSGHWQIGYRTLSASWPNASGRSYFAGDLDNTAVYGSALSAAQVRKFFAAGR